MKLLSKYNRIYLSASIVVFLITGIGYYFVISFALIHQLNHSLKDKLTEIKTYAQSHNALLPITNTRNQIIFYFPTNNPPTKASFSNIPEYVKEEKEIIQFRQLKSIISVNGHRYEVFIREPETETEDLIQLILVITCIIAAFFLLLLFVINRLSFQNIWKPFQHTLAQIQCFNLSTQNEITIQPTDITEFESLNNAVISMSGKVNKEYLSLKNFTENASHEMQTPLAILNARLDLLIQNENISESEIGQLQEMYQAVNRLTRLNKSLLLLTKIENRQFSETETIQLDQIIEEKIVQFGDQMKVREITIEKEIQPVALKMNHHLADIVVNNLISNAIRHNCENGTIKISLNNEEMTISNTGPFGNVDHNNIFKRFQKGRNSEGLGLGLAIVKQICDQYDFIIRYTFENNLHVFRIVF
ncbi:MAG: HAMP domain-containing sensor histidine kinase [Bacteroidota bacterium]|nr:HAMP domain-containing sensor histidine kinase [Bacteroidota bacterium]